MYLLFLNVLIQFMVWILTAQLSTHKTISKRTQNKLQHIFFADYTSFDLYFNHTKSMTSSVNRTFDFPLDFSLIFFSSECNLQSQCYYSDTLSVTYLATTLLEVKKTTKIRNRYNQIPHQRLSVIARSSKNLVAEYFKYDKYSVNMH